MSKRRHITQELEDKRLRSSLGRRGNSMRAHTRAGKFLPQSEFRHSDTSLLVSLQVTTMVDAKDLGLACWLS